MAGGLAVLAASAVLPRGGGDATHTPTLPPRHRRHLRLALGSGAGRLAAARAQPADDPAAAAAAPNVGCVGISSGRG